MSDEKKKNFVQGSGPLGDGFINDILNLGQGAENPLSATRYTKTQNITWDREALDAMLRQSWIVQRAVSVMAEDMCREKIQMQCPEIEPSAIELLEHEMALLNIWGALEETIIWGRLYGGAAAIMLIDGQDMATPLRPSTVGKGQFKGLYVLDRWTLWPEVQDLVSAFGPDFGLPRYYRIATAGGDRLDNQRVHHSRVLRFIGNKLPYWERIQCLYWGQSIVESMYDRLINFDATTAGASALVHKAHLKIHKIPGLTNIMAGVQEAQDALTRRVVFGNYMASNMSTMVIDSEEEINFATYSFGGLTEILIQMGEQLAGAIGTPTTRLFGQSPKGMSSTGESDIKGYYDTIGAKQEKDLRYPINRLLAVLIPSVLGIPMPDTFTFEFNSLWKLSDEESASIGARDIATATSAVDSGVYTPEIALREIRQLSRISGRGATVTDDDIEEIKSAVPPMPPDEGEMPEGSEATGGISAAPGGEVPDIPGNAPGLPGDAVKTHEQVSRSPVRTGIVADDPQNLPERKVPTQSPVDSSKARESISRFLGDLEEGEHWITTESGSKVLLGPGGDVRAGMGGKFTGQNISEIRGTQKEGNSAAKTSQPSPSPITAQEQYQAARQRAMELSAAANIAMEEGNLDEADRLSAEANQAMKETAEIYKNVGGQVQTTSVWVSNESVTAKEQKASIGSLTENEKAGITTYTGEDFSGINGGLRNPPVGEESQEAINQLDSLFSKTDNRTTGDIVAFRGTDGAIYDTLQPGMSFEDAAFTSTTAEKGGIDDFRSKDNSTTFIEVRIPKGSAAVSVEKYTAAKNEREILIDRGGQYRVVEVQDPPEGYKRKLIVELVSTNATRAA